MKSAIATVTAAALIGAASAQNFRVVAQTYLGTPGEFWGPYETWYGDGHMYVGPGKVPAGLSTVSKYTIPNFSETVPDIRIAGVEAGAIPADTFIAINNATGATEPVLFSNDESQLGEGSVNTWLRYGTYLLPWGPSSSQPEAEWNFYLEPTEEADTFRVTWRRPGTEDGGLQGANLTAVL